MPDVDLAAAFPSDTHPADDLDLDDVTSDFAFGRPCDIPPGIVGDATRVVFGTHWPALLRTVRAYRARVDALLTALGRRDARITRLQLALIAARREAACYRADHRDRHGLPSDPRHAGCRAADGDCAVPGCDGERIELEAFGMAKPIAVLMSCGHDTAPLEKPPEAPAEPDPQPAP